MFEKLSGYCSFDQFIDYGNSASTSEEVDVSGIKWKEVLLKNASIYNFYEVMSPNKTSDSHDSNDEIDSKVTM